MDLLNIPGFHYPQAFIEIINRNLIDFEPWEIMQDSYLIERYEGLKSRYPTRNLIPFARRTDNDDIACWELSDNNKVIIIHDFASSGWEEINTYENFWSWFKVAIDEMISFIDNQ